MDAPLCLAILFGIGIAGDEENLLLALSELKGKNVALSPVGKYPAQERNESFRLDLGYRAVGALQSNKSLKQEADYE